MSKLTEIRERINDAAESSREYDLSNTDIVTGE
jgi:hypothetical protein